MYPYRVGIFCRSIGSLLKNRKKFEQTIREIISQNEYTEFLCKNETPEDIAAAFAVRTITREYKVLHACVTLVLPYEISTESYRFELYNNVEISSNTILKHNLPDKASRDEYMREYSQKEIIFTNDKTLQSSEKTLIFT